MKQTVEIGGLPISFCLDGMHLDEKLLPFVSRKKPLLEVTNSFSEIPWSPPKEVLFATNNDFKVSQRDDGLLIEFKRRFLFSPRAIFIHRTFKKAILFLRNKKNPTSCSSPTYSWSYLLVYFLLVRGRGILAHACGVKDEGRGLLFVGPGGAGKSTIAKLFHGEKESVVLTDDRCIVRKMGKKRWLFGTPWHSDGYPLFSNERAPLQALFFLSHGRKNKITPLSFEASVKRLLPEMWLRSWDPEGIPFSIDFSLELCAEIPAYELAFVPTQALVPFLRDFIRKELPSLC